MFKWHMMHFKTVGGHPIFRKINNGVNHGFEFVVFKNLFVFWR